MYRPNRIGPHKIGNLNKALLVDAKASFDAVDNIWSTYSCYSLNVTSGTDFIAEHVVFSDLTLTLLDTQQVGIGVQLTGGDEEMHRYMYSVSGSITWRSVTDVNIEFVIGRLAAAPSTSVGIVVANPIVVPINGMNRTSGGAFSAWVNRTIVSAQLDGGSVPATFFDIAAFWRIINNDQGTAAIRGLMCNIAFHKYSEDLITFDPAR